MSVTTLSHRVLALRGVANLAAFTGQSTANVITQNLGSYAWALWISAIIGLFSFICAITVVILDKWLRKRYDVTDQTNGKRHVGATKGGTFSLRAIRHMSVSFWLVVLFAVFENAGVQSFVSISTYVLLVAFWCSIIESSSLGNSLNRG